VDDDQLDVVVVGGGIVGLAVARALAHRGREVHVLEAERQLGSHTSSRNSEVIHAGIYYPPGSLKARLCVRGREALYRFCSDAQVPHRRIGKLLVASSEDELATLGHYQRCAETNGVERLERLDAHEVAKLEPHVRCLGALLSPDTGIVDSHALLAALRRDAEAHGAQLVRSSPVARGRWLGARRGFELEVGAHAGAWQVVRARALVNCAGLWAQRLAQSLDGLDPATIPACHYAKGHYFVLRGPSPFQRLVYPVPSRHGLGIHVTLDLAGVARFGPDVCWIDEVDYRFDEGRLPLFESAIRRYYPALPSGSLQPGYTGIRPKLGPEGSVSQDFVIQGAASHGCRGLVNLYGIESPGLTAALAIADEVASMLP